MLRDCARPDMPVCGPAYQNTLAAHIEFFRGTRPRKKAVNSARIHGDSDKVPFYFAADAAKLKRGWRRSITMDDKIKTLREWIAGSGNIVFFGGAGVSTESGIPDFRSVDGLYNQQWRYPPETILSATFFERDPEEYYRFHHAKLVVDGAKPNRAHLRLAELEREGKLRAVVTQNIDGLHQAAGSKNVLELHGSILRAYCTRCHAPYPAEKMNHCEGVPRCDKCGGIVRPDIVLYEEMLDEDVLRSAVRFIRNADVLIVGGTSLGVYPAAGLINYYEGNKLALVNLSDTPYDRYANLVIHEKIGEVFSQV